MSGLLELAARVEALAGPDRDVDKEAHGYVDPVHIIHMDLELIDLRDSVKALGEEAWKIRGPGLADHVNRSPRYTASLEAAISLAPVGWKLRQMNFSAPCADDRKWHLNLHGGKVGEDTFVGRGATPALALCAAALRARAKP